MDDLSRRQIAVARRRRELREKHAKIQEDWGFFLTESRYTGFWILIIILTMLGSCVYGLSTLAG